MSSATTWSCTFADLSIKKLGDGFKERQGIDRDHCGFAQGKKKLALCGEQVLAKLHH